MSKIVGASGFSLCSALGSECVLLTNLCLQAIHLYVLLAYLSLLKKTLRTSLLLLSVCEHAFPRTSGLLLSAVPLPHHGMDWLPGWLSHGHGFCLFFPILLLQAATEIYSLSALGYFFLLYFFIF